MQNTQADNRKYISRKEAVKIAKQIAAKNPDYEFTSNASHIFVTDMNRKYLHGSFFHQVFRVDNSGKRTKEQIAAGEPIQYWVVREENHWVYGEENNYHV